MQMTWWVPPLMTGSVGGGRVAGMRCHRIQPAAWGAPLLPLLCFSLLLFAFSWDMKRIFPSPAHDLGVSTIFISSLTPTRSMLFHTEVGAFQGGGLCLLPALAQRWGLGTDLLAKALFFMCLLAFLV